MVVPKLVGVRADTVYSRKQYYAFQAGIECPCARDVFAPIGVTRSLHRHLRASGAECWNAPTPYYVQFAANTLDRAL